MSKDNFFVHTDPSFKEPDISRWVWCLEDIRNELIKQISPLNQHQLDQPMEQESTIGSLLYHIALVEADWLFVEVLEQENFDSDLLELFPYPFHGEDKKLSMVTGDSIEFHLLRLRKVRERLHIVFQQMSLAEYRRPRTFDTYNVTPEWVIYHLIEHEANHRGQIFSMIRQIKNS
ncbi:DinB family protein [Alkalihalobacillus trypoxylicola]|uniref:DinB-like domain-containing protein n=1 Tax=Alkalihalobacillus trypoxylicola TaxID=519424 RepID=A0A161Q217_9BACI|nr:DinB family protein [Alkalihalobacillus trypoxylicola]KYG29563.1 hypothetical protein AZF04_08580 [Alkalihalobacillus trypoxylicola]